MTDRSKTNNQNMPQRAVIFDFDGTIADSWPVIVSVGERMLGRTEKFTDEELAELRTLSVTEVLRRLRIPAWRVPIMVFKGRQQLRRHMHDIPLHDGMEAVIKHLHKAGIPLYVLSSNSTENVQRYLRWHHLDKYFSAVYGGVSIFAKAPRLLKLIDAENIDVAGSWYVGDETRDVSAARSVGLHAASVTWGFGAPAALTAKGPDALVTSATALQKVLDDAWKK